MITCIVLVPKWFKTSEVNYIPLNICSGAFVYCVMAKNCVLTDLEDGPLVSFAAVCYPSQDAGKNVE